MPFATLVWLISPAPAQDCDIEGLKQALWEASPAVVAGRFVDVAKCDPESARSAAAKVVPRFLAGPDANHGVLAAIDAGAGDVVRDWLSGLDVRERTPTIDWLGNQCEASAQVADFFLDAQQTDPDAFWSERWYRGLSDCRSESIGDLLTEALEAQSTDSDRVRFYALVGVYARNQRAESLPTLVDLLSSVADNERRLVVEAFADAANVGSADGMDTEAADAAVQALVGAAEHVPADTVEAMRNTLTSLGDPVAAEGAARFRWPDRFDGSAYTYVAIAHELWTCKNGKQYGAFHVGEVREPGLAWPDTLAVELGDRLADPWGLGRAATKCKGETDVQVVVTDEPLVDGQDVSDWIEQEHRSFVLKTDTFKKVDTIDQPTVAL